MHQLILTPQSVFFSPLTLMVVNKKVSNESINRRAHQNGSIKRMNEKQWESEEKRGNLLRSVPFLMAGHLNIKTFQTLDTPFFNTNPKNGCPKMICQYSGQAPRHFTCRFHYMSCSTDVRPWDSKRKFLFLLQIVPITKTLVPNALK